MQRDRFSSYPIGSFMAEFHFPVAPSDTVDLPEKPRMLWCNSAGTVAIRDAEGTLATYTVNAGSPLMIRAVRVMATGTTASLIGMV